MDALVFRGVTWRFTGRNAMQRHAPGQHGTCAWAALGQQQGSNTHWHGAQGEALDLGRISNLTKPNR